MNTSHAEVTDGFSATDVGAEPEKAASASGGIMVVDDTPSALHLMVELLSREGYTVRPASTGELALRSAMRTPPELILLDVQMPGMDGYAVCRKLKAEPTTAGVPVIFLSALNDTESRVRGLEVGAQDFISKPFQAEEVLARVRTHLMLGRTMQALDDMCTDLQQAVVERSSDLDELSTTLARQVSDHRETARRLQLASRAIDSAHDAILVTAPTGEILSANPASHLLTGFTRDELVGMPVLQLFEDGDAGGITAGQLLTGRRTGQWAGEVWIRPRAEPPVPVWMSVAEFREGTAEVSHYVAVFSDLSQRKESEAKIRYLAEHDLLTGLPNRLLLQDRFNVSRSIALRDKERLALLFIDIDKFKTINDSMGHSIGDGFLRRVAAATGEVLRSSDALSRIGGDEFLAMVSGISSVAQVSNLADRILRRLDQEFLIDGHALRRSVSIGIALYPDDGEEFDELARKADTAMYQAKQAGRNKVIFHTDQMNKDLQARLKLETALRSAIADDELFMRYQPQVDLRTGRIVGLEALVRWQRPEHGEVMPNEFIPVAEESGLVVDLGARTLRLVCEQVRRWHAQGIAVPVAVNISPVQIWHGGLDVTVMDILRETGVPGEYLEIEVTESGLIDDTPKTQELVERLNGLGVRLSIDDFLTGYSNFTYLRQFHPSHLKIDQSFVASMSEGSENQAIVRAAIQMAEVLGIPTIAEGVETEEQAGLLRVAGCPIGQGYLFARALSVEDVTDLLVRGTCWPVSATQTQNGTTTGAIAPASDRGGQP